MGRKIKQGKSQEELYETLSKMMVSSEILKDFEITDIKEFKDIWQIELYEKTERIPQELKGKANIALDGFCNPIEALSHSFSLKPVYLKIYRRRWKESNTDKHYSNNYDFTLKGVKLVPEMGIFLKEDHRIFSR